MSASIGLLLSLVALIAAVQAQFPVELEVKIGLKSRSANIHVSEVHHSLYPFTVTYGACHSSLSYRESHHTISHVSHGHDRLVWILPDDISTGGCLSAWSTQTSLLIGRSEPLEVDKSSRQWAKKRDLDQGMRLSKRASIPMSNASGIDAEGPWFDGVEALKDNEISAVNVKEAKAKSRPVGLSRELMLICYRQKLLLWEPAWLA